MNHKQQRHRARCQKAFLLFLVWMLCTLYGLSAEAVFGAEQSVTISVYSGAEQLLKQAVTWRDLASLGMVRQSYTSMDASGLPQIVYTEGIPVAQLLAAVGSTTTDLESIHFDASDGWSRSYTKAYLLDTPRYRYDTLGEGTSGEASAVQSLLALKNYERRLNGETSTTEVEADWSQLSTVDGLRICFGQKDTAEQCSANFGKHINKIEIKLKAGSSIDAGPLLSLGSGQGAMENDDIGNLGGDDMVKQANALPDTLTIKVGYFGQEYYVKKVFTFEELKNLPQTQQAYTFIDSMPSVVMESAQGVTLANLLEAAGIDMNSVETFYFYCTDLSSSWYESMSRTYLLDTTRYYYPHLANCWDKELQASTVGAEEGAIKVEPMIAWQENWTRFAKTPDFSDMTDESRFRLVFGQTDINTKTAYRSAKWIHSIEIMLGGKPPEEEGNQGQLEGLLGSSYRDGEKPSGQSPPTAKDASGHPENTAKPAQKKLVEWKTNAHELSGEKEAGDATHYEEDAGLQKWRVYEMSNGASSLKNIPKDSPVIPLVLIGLPTNLLLGGLYRFLFFRRTF